MLLLSVKSQMNIRGEGGFTEKEYYRMKKIGQRLAKELSNVEDAEGIKSSVPAVSHSVSLNESL